MAAPTKKLSPWLVLADVVLAVLLQDHETEAYESAMWQYRLSPDHLPPEEIDGAQPYPLVWGAIIALRANGETVTPQTVYDQIGGQVSIEWIYDRSIGYTETQAEAFDTNVKKLLGYGQRWIDIQKLKNAQQQLISGGADRDRIVSALINELASNGFAAPSDPTIGGSLDEIEREMELDPLKPVRTGITWLDNMVGGFLAGKLYVVAGRFKDRKTTLLRNMALAAPRNGGSVTIASYEVTRKDFMYDLLAMLAVEYLHKNALYSKSGGAKQFNGTLLQMARSSYKTWSREFRDAWQYAKDTARAIDDKIRVYDGTQTGGGIWDPASLKIKIQRDQDQYGGDNFVLGVDHLQIMGDSTIDLTPRTEAYMTQLKQIAIETNCTIVLLSQLNQERVKQQNTRSEKKDRSGGGKGSGNIMSSCDLFLSTRYGLTDGSKTLRPEWLDITLELARWAESSSQTTERLLIHPASGYVLGAVDMDDEE